MMRHGQNQIAEFKTIANGFLLSDFQITLLTTYYTNHEK
jgi:hypothetical protein